MSVMPDVAEPGVVIVGVTGPLMNDQAPVPTEGVFAAIVAVPLVAQMVCGLPALAAVGGAIAVIITSSMDAVQGLLLDVQRNVRVPAVLRPVMVVVGEEALVMVAAVPPTWLQAPTPVVTSYCCPS